MSKYTSIIGTKLFGIEVSDYGKQCGKLDYETLLKSVSPIFGNCIFDELSSKGYCFEIVNGSECNCENNDYRSYIVSATGSEILQLFTDDLVYYCNELDLYIWMMKNSYIPLCKVLTNIELNATE